MSKFVSGFITIIGLPNVGKSTFMNSVLGSKVVIMSDKPQTTRNKIQGIYTDEDSQLIFIDTPGVHKPKHELGKYMTNSALSAIKGVDIILYMVSANQDLGKGNMFIIENLKKTKLPIFLVINKIDLIKNKSNLDKLILEYKEHLDIKGVFPISALNGINVNYLLDEVKDNLEEGPMYFPEDQITDHPEKFIISELVREKVLHLTRDEIPHSIAVVVEKVKKSETNDNIIDCMATIIVERDSQKGIIIGKGGSMLKQVGTLARKDISELLGSKIYLELFVKVKKDWRNKRLDLKNFGYNS